MNGTPGRAVALRGEFKSGNRYFGHRASAQVSFRLIPKVLNAVYMVAIVREPLAVIDPTMPEASHL